MSSNNNRSNSRPTTRRTQKRQVEIFDPADYETGVYKSERKLKRIGMGIRRGDTRHGDYSNVVLWKPKDDEGPSKRFVMTLAEARAFKEFLDRELEMRAR